MIGCLGIRHYAPPASLTVEGAFVRGGKMQIELTRLKVPVELGASVALDVDMLVGDPTGVIDLSMTTLPFDADNLQLIVMVTRREQSEQEAYDRAVKQSMIDQMPDPEDLE